MPAARILAALAVALAATACPDPDPDPSNGGDVSYGKKDGGSDAGEQSKDAGEDRRDGGEDPGRDAGADAGADAGFEDDECLAATGPGAQGTALFIDGDERAEVTIDDPARCLRRYSLQTTLALRDNFPANPRTFVERSGQPTVRTNNHLFDALYALAVEEARENSVDAIRDGSFNDGAPLACPPGGCFETGRNWHYVWTRDTAYSVDLALAALDPTRARNSLELKLSERREGGDLQIVQDTGTGGSYPVSTDRVSWALGASRLLDFLDGSERAAFRDRTYEALRNTIEHDRLVVFDPADGLYTGEQSFLDWREQSYPDWTAADTVHIGMSKSLSTNVLHLHALSVAAALAAEESDEAARARYQSWADDLREAIRARFWLPEEKLFSSFSTTFLDPAPARRYDLLASALAVILGVADEAQATEVLANYPHAGKGPPTLWPQQQATAIYHNRSFWPFVTAYWTKAARAARNDKVVNHAIWSLMRGAALNLSNMENFELVTGANWLEEGATSGPVVNSQRQLWSVAGYLAMVQSVIFGLETSPQGIRFLPYVTRHLRNDVFGGADSIVLNNFPYRGRRITVVVHLPAKINSNEGAYAVGSVKLNGVESGTGFLPSEQLAVENTIEITLAEASESGSPMRVVEDTAAWRNVFGPKTPTIDAITVEDGKLKLALGAGGEAADDIAFRVYRDGELAAEGIAGSAGAWIDPASGDHLSKTRCYAVESYFLASGNTSQRSRPSCFWGRDDARVRMVGARDFRNIGGDPVVNHGRFHFQDWGDAGHELVIDYLRPDFSGEHLLQLVYGNGAGPINTGVTCAVKKVSVEELPSGNVVAEGQVFMPHVGSWSEWRDSSFLRATLDATKAYRVRIHDDARSINMSAFSHFEAYTAGLGGRDGAFNRVNVSHLKLLALQGAVAATPAASFDGISDYDELPEANKLTPGITLVDWERFALIWDEDFIYVAVVSSAFGSSGIRPYMFYVQGSSAPFAAPAARDGMTYDNQTANVPFEAEHLVAVRRTSDTGDGAGPWNGLLRWDNGGWVRQQTFEEGRDFWVGNDSGHTLSFRVRRSQLGFPTRLRIAGHLVSGGGNYNDVVPSADGGPQHEPWVSGRTEGFYEIDLTGPTGVAAWVHR